MSNIPTPKQLRKIAKELYEQERSDAQIGWTPSAKTPTDAYAYFWDEEKPFGRHIWYAWNTDEKAMLCLFFAEYLEGEK